MSNAIAERFALKDGESIVTRDAGTTTKTGRPLARLAYEVQGGILLGKGRLAPQSALRAYSKQVGAELIGKELAKVRVAQQREFDKLADKTMESAREAITNGSMQTDTCLIKTEMVGDKPVITGYVFKVKVAGTAMKREAFAESLRKVGITGERFDTLMTAWDKTQS